MTLKRWKARGKPLLIPEQHEPGVQKGPYGGKPQHQPSHTKGGQSIGTVQFYNTAGGKNQPPKPGRVRRLEALAERNGQTRVYGGK